MDRKDADKIKDAMNALSGMTGGLENLIKDLPNKILPMAEEMQKFISPKAKREVKINGKICSMQVLTDGRIVINLGSLEEGQAFYNAFETISKSAHDEEMTRMNGLIFIERKERVRLEHDLILMKDELQKEKEKTWFQKLLGR